MIGDPFRGGGVNKNESVSGSLVVEIPRNTFGEA